MDEHKKIILAELQKWEEELLAAEATLQAAEMRKAIAMSTFATVRDHARQELEGSPYRLAADEWPHLKNPKAGRFRFALMKVGDAAAEVLWERGELRIEQLFIALRQGGSDVRSERDLHTALLNKKGIAQKGDNISLIQEVTE